MPAYRTSGSEEFYRQRPGQPGFDLSYNRDTLELMNRATERNIAQRREIGDIGNETRRLNDEALANSISGAYQGYRQGKADKRTDETHQKQLKQFDTEEAQAREVSEARQLQNSQTKQQMEAADADRKRLYEPGASGKSAWQEDRDRQAENDRLNQTLVRTQIGGMGEDRKTVKTEQNVQKLSELMETAISSSNQAELANLRAQGTQLGLSQMDIQRAERTATKSIASGGMSKDVYYQGTPEGQLATDSLVDISKKAKGLATFNNAAAKYKSALPGTDDADIALSEMESALVGMGKDPKSISRALWIGSRDGKIDKVITDIQGELSRELKEAKIAAGGAGPGMRGSFQNAENLVNQVAPQKGGPVDIFTGQQQSGAKTGMMNVLMGGQPPQQQQQAPMRPQPASVSPAAQAQQQQGRSRFNRGN